ncbi:class I SAM-dependent methyltransferase [Butyrivibrio fibrisolvens]|uniref:class I SAM-dependent methyltransferase n=1 Tax=Butyrivibrio fibrisolvens TaxID=831 RepID=UPI0003B51EFC|nr:class I SAM-dependent methyltransferase [Butyrivibrio fibrisolvens]
MDIIKMIKKIIMDIGYDSVKHRDEFVIEQLKELKAGSSLLDCGAGEQKYRKNCNHLKYTSQDFCEYDGKATAGLDRNGKWDTSKIDIISDIINIPVDEESFDAILCTEVFEHIAKPDLAVREFSRILKNNGKLILTAPFASYTHMAPYHFCTGFDKYWYYSILEENGFIIEKIVPNGDYYTELATDIRRLPYVLKTYGHKVDVVTKILAVLFYRRLSKIKLDNSSEYRCNEYMVVARKRVL